MDIPRRSLFSRSQRHSSIFWEICVLFLDDKIDATFNLVQDK